MSVTFDAAAIWATRKENIRRAVVETSREAAEAARGKAPVRKVFQGSRGRTSRQSIEEAASEARVRSQLGLAPGRVQVQRTPAARVHDFGPRRLLASPRLPAYDVAARRYRGASGRFQSPGLFRALQGDRPGTLRFDTPLTKRGRYELRTGRANIIINGQTFVGGRLRSEIAPIRVSVSDEQFSGGVISPTPYAKYVEYGTRHARQQSYLRPAIASQREAFMERLQRAIK